MAGVGVGVGVVEGCAFIATANLVSSLIDIVVTPFLQR